MWSQLLLLALFFCASLVACQEDIETERAARVILYKVSAFSSFLAFFPHGCATLFVFVVLTNQSCGRK